MKRAKAKRAAKKPAPYSVLTTLDASRLRVIDRRLQRCCDLMSCIDYCLENGAELDLNALALAARDLLDTVRADLAPLCAQAVQSRGALFRLST